MYHVSEIQVQLYEETTQFSDTVTYIQYSMITTVVEFIVVHTHTHEFIMSSV